MMAPVQEEQEEQSEDLRGDEAQGERDVEADEDAQAQGHEGEEEVHHPRGLRDPGQPTQAMIEEHNRSHLPFRPWCAACVYGKAKRKPSLRIMGSYSHSCLPRVRMDYAHLTDESEETSGEHGEKEVAEAEGSLTTLVMQESQHSSVWAYAVEHKGAAEY